MLEGKRPKECDYCWNVEDNSNQLLNYTNIIKENSIEIKKDIIEHLWKVLISDNTVDQYESNLMRRLTGLLYIDSKTMGDIKEQIKKENL